MTTATMSVSDAKAQLSSIIRRVESEGARFVIEKNNRPVAKIVPLAGTDEKSACGALSAYADRTLAAHEDGALARAMEDKHASRR